MNPIRYRGYYWDSETNLYYLQSRYYDPTTMRFINADGQFADEDLFGNNLFIYCSNNPVMRCDPSGESWLSVLAACTTIVVAAAAAVVAAPALVAAGVVGTVATVTTTAYTVGVAATGVGLFAAGMEIGENVNLYKENIRDTGLIGLSDSELAELLKKAKGKEKLRYQKEQKARKTRNAQKRNSHYTAIPDYIDQNGYFWTDEFGNLMYTVYTPSFITMEDGSKIPTSSQVYIVDDGHFGRVYE